jgi:NADPH-dependent glutamate synthase beta subunit-like oxidoreductase
VREYTRLISQGKFNEALKIVKKSLPFPRIVGRVCTHPCENKCRRKDVESSIAICDLKRFISDYDAGVEEDLTIYRERVEKIAIVGGGPAGLMAAYDLRKKGYKVTIFDTLPELGGMLYAGIPEYRLPLEVLRHELEIIYRLGIIVRLNTLIGSRITIADLKKEFSAIFIAIGKHVSEKLNIPGEDLESVHYGMNFLREMKQKKKVVIGRKIAVIGGGNVAIDAARTALRLNKGEVTILYRRTSAEMPAIPREVEEAKKEGIEIYPLVSPLRIVGSNGKVKGIECIRMKLEEPDERGRKRPIPIPGSGIFLEVDGIIVAIGQRPNNSLFSEANGLMPYDGKILKVDPLSLSTEVEGVFAGGDVVVEAGTVIDSLAAGRKAAFSIDHYIRAEELRFSRSEVGSQETRLLVDVNGVRPQSRASMPTLPLADRKGNFRPIELGFNEEQAIQEAERCLDCKCNLCVRDCEFLKKHCGFPKELAGLFKEGYFREKPEIPYSCNICGLCEKVCPDDLNIGEMCMLIRQKLVEEGIGPLPQHQTVKRTQEFVLSDSFHLVQSDPEAGRCERVFFPGCNLAGYSPSLVMKSYKHLQERMPGTGIILGCCGAPNHFLGEYPSFREILAQIKRDMEKLDAPEMIVACPDCHRTLKENVPEIKLRSIYEVLLEIGLPNGIKIEQLTLSLHDSCTTRYERVLQDNVRELLKRIGCDIEESFYSKDKTRCCGMGGMLPFIDFELAAKVTARRAAEFHFDIVCYCASCREAFAIEKPAVHLLDLIFNPAWKEARLMPPKTGRIRREAQLQTKNMLIELLEKNISVHTG